MLFRTYPTCSLYPPRLMPPPRFSFPGSHLLLSRLHSPWSIPCCPVSPLSTVLTKTVSPQCFPFFPHHKRLTLSHFYSILFWGSFSALFSSHPPKIRRVFAKTLCQSTMNLEFSPLALYIYPLGNPPSILFSFFSRFLSSLLPACPHCRSTSSCYQYSNGLESPYVLPTTCQKLAGRDFY